MRPLIAVLLLLSPAALARDPFPADYKPAPCAQREKVCQSFPQSQMAEIAAMRGVDVGQEWIDAHWTEMMQALDPVCSKLATCFATAGNDNLFCVDVFTPEAMSLCNRFPAGSKDREKCNGFMAAYTTGVDHNSKPVWQEMQSCAVARKTDGERTFEHWMVPNGDTFAVYAIDTETRVPVQARVILPPTKKPVFADSADGQPATFYNIAWKPQLVRVPNTQGHRDVAPPELRIEAPGYRTETFRMDVEVPQMKVEMNPPVSKLRRGKNRVTITATDAATGKPVEARVMGGELVLGKTNEPFELEWKKGTKLPEIWVTNLYDRYSDVVVCPGK